MGRRPLSGIKVLDLSRVFAGPWATQVLADMGAEVVKVERPGKGDDSRGLGPPFLQPADGGESAESAFYLSANRNKKCISIDISTSDGQALVRRFAAGADIVVENYKVGTLARYGLDYASLSRDNPGLIYCSLTGFGQDGPYRHRPGYDTLFQAVGGVMSVTGEPGGRPLKSGIILGDLFGGMYAAISVLGALQARAHDGLGQHIDLSILDSQVAALSHQGMYYLVSGRNPTRIGNAAPAVVPSQMFECADGYIALVVGNDTQFPRFAAILGHPEWAEDPRFRTNRLRVQNREALLAMVEPIFRTRPKADWLAAMEEQKLVAGPINEISDVLADPHVNARGMVVEIEHPLGVPLRLIANPIHYSRTPLDVYTPPPMNGEHTDDLLAGLGLSRSEIDDLAERGVIGRAAARTKTTA